MTQARDFWSRRKAAVEAEAKAEALAVEDQIIAAHQARLEDRSDAEILAEFDLPDPDTLQAGDQVSGFMAKAVPDRLRRRALRRLWRLNPVLANVDGLVDYGEDFTDTACVIENLQTAYQVGKGMLTHVETLAAAAEEADAEPEVEAPEDVIPDAAADEPAPQGVEPEPGPLQMAGIAAPEETGFSPAPRSMKFEFEG